MKLSLQQEYDLLGQTFVAIGIAMFEVLLGEVEA